MVKISLKELAILDSSKQMPSSMVSPIDEVADLVLLDGILKEFNIFHNFSGESLLVAIRSLKKICLHWQQGFVPCF